MKAEFVIGTVVQSTAGHDKGGWFVITEVIDDDYVQIADGMTRTLEKPKKKKRKHLKAIPAPRMESNQAEPLMNADLRKFLKACNESLQ